MMIVGVTGGIGSGKTTVCQVFRALGIPVYDADLAARELYDRDPELMRAVREAFGDGVLDAEGRLDRKQMAAIVFSDPARLEMLNALVHPRVRSDFRKWVKQQTHAPYVIREAAILFESGTHKDCDRIVTVTAPVELRKQRIRQRDQRSEEEIGKVMERQWSDEEKIRRSDAVLVNDEKELLLPRILALHQEFLQQALPNLTAS
jgi:dephospho-CoA kinase